MQNIDSPLLVGFVSKALLGRALALTIHGEVIEPKRRSPLGRLRLRWMYRLVDAFAVLTSRAKRQLERDGVQGSRIHVIPNAVDYHFYRPPSETEVVVARQFLGISPSLPVAVFVGRLHRLKRVDMLLKAWSTLSPNGEHCLLIVGDGPELGNLRDLADKLGIASTVRFEGRSERVLLYLHAADVFVLPSSEEGISLALLEAMSVSLTVVASAVPGNEVVVRHGENGLLFQVNDIAGLQNQLRLAFGSVSHRKRLGAEARATIEKDFTPGTVLAAHWRLYRELLTRSRQSLQYLGKRVESSD